MKMILRPDIHNTHDSHSWKDDSRASRLVNLWFEWNMHSKNWNRNCDMSIWWNFTWKWYYAQVKTTATVGHACAWFHASTGTQKVRPPMTLNISARAGEAMATGRYGLEHENDIANRHSHQWQWLGAARFTFCVVASSHKFVERQLVPLLQSKLEQAIVG